MINAKLSPDFHQFNNLLLVLTNIESACNEILGITSEKLGRPTMSELSPHLVHLRVA